MTSLPGVRGNMKFWANKNNYLKHLVNLLNHYSTAIEHGETVGDVVNESHRKFVFPEQVADTILLLKSEIRIDRDINGITTKSIDSSHIKIPIRGTLIIRKKLKDSINFLNENERAGNDYWLKND